jgi:hypothetical protein
LEQAPVVKTPSDRQVGPGGGCSEPLKPGSDRLAVCGPGGWRVHSRDDSG